MDLQETRDYVNYVKIGMEDELHFLFACRKYSQEHEQLLNHASELKNMINIEHFKLLCDRPYVF